MCADAFCQISSLRKHDFWNLLEDVEIVSQQTKDLKLIATYLKAIIPNTARKERNKIGASSMHVVLHDIRRRTQHTAVFHLWFEKNHLAFTQHTPNMSKDKIDTQSYAEYYSSFANFVDVLAWALFGLQSSPLVQTKYRDSIDYKHFIGVLGVSFGCFSNMMGDYVSPFFTKHNKDKFCRCDRCSWCDDLMKKVCHHISQAR